MTKNWNEIVAWRLFNVLRTAVENTIFSCLVVVGVGCHKTIVRTDLQIHHQSFNTCYKNYKIGFIPAPTHVKKEYRNWCWTSFNICNVNRQSPIFVMWQFFVNWLVCTKECRQQSYICYKIYYWYKSGSFNFTRMPNFELCGWLWF